jgi:hypothetical protein
MKVLRFWDRISGLQEVMALAPTARWWLYGVTMSWTGHNNGVIEFTRRKHAAPYGLTDRKVFERARRDVLATGLVQMTRQGGRNLPALYFLTRIVVQAAPPSLRRIESSARIKFGAEMLGGSQPTLHEKTWGSRPPNREFETPKEIDLHIKIARASDLEKEKLSREGLC